MRPGHRNGHAAGSGMRRRLSLPSGRYSPPLRPPFNAPGRSARTTATSTKVPYARSDALTNGTNTFIDIPLGKPAPSRRPARAEHRVKD
jgi:hypothetical protein